MRYHACQPAGLRLAGEPVESLADAGGYRVTRVALHGELVGLHEGFIAKKTGDTEYPPSTRQQPSPGL